MAQYNDVIRSLTVGSGIPTGWTDRWVAPASTSVISGATPVGDRYLRRAPSVASTHLLSWNTIDADGNRANSEVLTVMRFSVAQPNGSITIRGANGSAFRDGYNLSNTTEMRVLRLLNGSTSALFATPFTVVTNQWYGIRMRINGSSIRARMWLLSEREPSAWQIDGTNSEVTAAGWVGIYTNNGNHDTAWFSVGTNGDTAPAFRRWSGAALLAGFF